MQTPELSVLKQDSLVILETHGYINNLAGEKIAEKCFELTDKGYKNFILDLADSKVVNSIGISILIEIIEKIIEIEGKLSFCNLTPTIDKTFRIMGLFQFTRAFPSREEALAAFESEISGQNNSSP